MNLKPQQYSHRVSTPQQINSNNIPTKFQYLRVDKSVEIRRNSPKVSSNKKPFNDSLNVKNLNNVNNMNIIHQMDRPASSDNNLAKSAQISYIIIKYIRSTKDKENMRYNSSSPNKTYKKYLPDKTRDNRVYNLTH